MHIKAQQQVILTGIPRSGTTLTCHLLNKLTNCVALHEPLTPLLWRNYSRSDLIDSIDQAFIEQRQHILETGTATSKSFAGTVPDNPVSEFDSTTGKRIRVLDGKSINIKKNLSKDFYLAIKHPAFFTAILPDLISSERFNCFAIIRNPISVLLSWNTVEMPVAQGRTPVAEAFAGHLTDKLISIENKYDRQIFLLDWFFQQYLQYLPSTHILRYERTIESGGKSLAIISPMAEELNECLISKNNNSLYGDNLKESLMRKLLNYESGAFWKFYSEADIYSIANVS